MIFQATGDLRKVSLWLGFMHTCKPPKSTFVPIQRPLLLHGEGGITHANDWACGFMRGVRLHYKSWKELFDDKEHACLLVPILVLAHEHDPDPEMRPLKGNIDVERREKLILLIATGVTAIYRYFAPQVGWKQGSTQKNGISPSRAKNRTQRSLTLRFENLPPICVFF